MRFYGIFVFVSFCVLLLIVLSSINNLKRKGISPLSGKSQKIYSFLIYPVFIIILFLWLFEVLNFAFHFPIFLLPTEVSDVLFKSVFLQVSGIIMVLISLIFLKLSLFSFGNSLRFGFDENNPGKLVTTGIFSVSRNPFFLSLDIYFYGIALIFPSWFFLIFTVVAIIGIHFYILKEEKFMQKVYGKEYEEYAEKVKRYVSLKNNSQNQDAF